MTELLQPGIRDQHHMALRPLLARLQALDLTPLLVYHLDLVPASLLPILAEQFAVMGFGGWDLVHTEAERRALIRSAIELHRHKGTPWALRQALERVGWPGAVIHERVDEGLYPEGWATFEVAYDLESRAVTEADLRNITGVIREWKPLSRHIKAVSMALVLDAVSVPRPKSKWDGSAKFDGSMKYDGPSLGELAWVRVNAAFKVPVRSRELVDGSHQVLHFGIAPEEGVGLDLRDFELLDGAGHVLASVHRPIALLKNSAFAITGEWPVTITE